MEVIRRKRKKELSAGRLPDKCALILKIDGVLQCIRNEDAETRRLTSIDKKLLESFGNFIEQFQDVSIIAKFFK